MRWLFRFNLATERHGGDAARAQGLGHARRCAVLARTLQQHHAGEAFLLVEGPGEVAGFLNDLRLPYALNTDERAVLDKFRPGTIVVDINDLPAERIRWYRRWAPVVNLAPRGQPKYHADATFTAVSTPDCPAPVGAPLPPWFRGPAYAVVGEEFSRLRDGIDQVGAKWDPHRVVVSMGGVDHHNLTGVVVRGLASLRRDVRVCVIVGPHSPHGARIDSLLRELEISAEQLVAPADMARAIVEAGVGIFGAGIVAYEALCVGVPGIHVGLAPFHRLVAEELHDLGIGRYAGAHDRIGPTVLSDMVMSWLDEPDRLPAMRHRAMDLVDGRGARRIVDTVAQLFGES